MAIVARKRGLQMVDGTNVYCTGTHAKGRLRGQRCTAWMGTFRSVDGGRRCHDCGTWNEIKIVAAPAERGAA